jgi:bisphosphoglycerate-independent phosphoglycerate mutase (AlkP superfamily)
MTPGRPLVLTILDGWGFSPAVEGNAIAAARKPNYDALLRDYPNTLVQTSGPSVGLPDGQMGNSEVGHLNIGATSSATRRFLPPCTTLAAVACISWACSATAACIR